MDHVVVDVEIQKKIEEVEGGWGATDKLGVAVACLWETKTRRMRVYGPDDVEALRTRLERAERISGFNIMNFDYPVIWGIDKRTWIGASLSLPPKGDREVGMLKRSLEEKTNDILRRIWLSLKLNPDQFVPRTHGGWPLWKVAKSTLGVDKIGNGADAPKWYQAGEIQRVVNYCSDDVALERDLVEFVDRYGYVLRDGEKLEMAGSEGR